MQKDSQEYKDAKAYAEKLANETGLPSVIKLYSDGSYRVQTLSFRDVPYEFEIVNPHKTGPDGPERTMS